MGKRTQKVATRAAMQKAFLAAFAIRGNITRAMEDVGHDRSTHYAWLEEDATYPGRFGAAKEAFADGLEEEARRRAVEGVERVRFSGGKILYREDGTPWIEREHSDSLLSQMLKAHRPDKYKDRQEVQHSGEIRTVQSLLSDVPDGGPTPP